MAEEGEDAFEACLQKTLTFLAERGFSHELRQEQKSSRKQLFTGGDVLAVLPTGFGKSMIFQLLALMKEDCVALVIYPLKSTVNDQIKEASLMGISAGSLSDCLQTDKNKTINHGTGNSHFLQEYCVGKPSDFVWLVT